jgi:hypothetical protein
MQDEPAFAPATLNGVPLGQPEPVELRLPASVTPIAPHTNAAP